MLVGGNEAFCCCLLQVTNRLFNRASGACQVVGEMFIGSESVPFSDKRCDAARPLAFL